MDSELEASVGLLLPIYAAVDADACHRFL
jgi:hypothetical protein